MSKMNKEHTQRLDGPMLTREAGISSDSIISEEERRVKLSFSSEEPYVRSSWFDDPWVEILGHDKSEVDMGRLSTGGAPLLYNHSSHGRDNHIGVVEKAWIENGRGYAEVRFSKRADVDGVWNDVKDGILTGVSVGYKINERQLIKEHKDQPNEYRVVRWEPMEISMVPLAADPTVGVGRSEKFVIHNVGDVVPHNEAPNEVKEMDENEVVTTEVTETETTTEQGVDVAARAVADEKQRQSEIRKLIRSAKLPETDADSLVDSGATVESARSMVLGKLIEKGGAETVAHHRVEVGKSGAERFIEDASDAIIARAGLGQALSTNQMRGYDLAEIARRSLEHAGVRTDGMDKMVLIGRAFTQTGSDFPILLENTMHKVLQNAYAVQADTWSRFCATGSVSDFRAHNRYRIGSFGNLDVLTDAGEIKNKSIPDGEKSSISASTKANIINLTRKAIIDDDLGAFVNLAANLGRAARRTIEADVYALLAENSGLGPTMSDGKTLFHADHGNIGAGAAISVDSIEADRVLMASQLDVSGNDFLDLRPQSLVLPVGLGGSARVINDAQYDPDTANKLQRPNKVRGLFSDIVDTPRLSGTRRYMFADQGEAPTIEVAFLNGNREPFLEMQQGFNVDGSQWKVRIDYGVAAIDYRGAVTNAGA